LVHLDRSIRALRNAILAAPSDAGAWNALCDVLARRGRAQAAGCVSAMTVSLGFADARSSRLAQGHRPLGTLAFADTQLDAFRPESLDSAKLELLRFVSRRADALLPARKPGPRVSSPTEALRSGLGSALEQLDHADLVLLERDGRTCLPLRDKPLTLEISRELVASCDADQLAFLLLRALALGELGLTGIADAPLDALAAALEVTPVQSEPPPPDAPKPGREHALGGRGSRELAALVKAAAARGELDPEQLVADSWQAASRLAFAALGNLGAALRALGACAEPPEAASYAQAGPFDALERSAEARELLRFAISDVFLDSHPSSEPRDESGTLG